jgi:hypothetical protein
MKKRKSRASHCQISRLLAVTLAVTFEPAAPVLLRRSEAQKAAGEQVGKANAGKVKGKKGKGLDAYHKKMVSIPRLSPLKRRT